MIRLNFFMRNVVTQRWAAPHPKILDEIRESWHARRFYEAEMKVFILRQQRIFIPRPTRFLHSLVYLGQFVGELFIWVLRGGGGGTSLHVETHRENLGVGLGCQQRN